MLRVPVSPVFPARPLRKMIGRAERGAFVVVAMVVVDTDEAVDTEVVVATGRVTTSGRPS